MLATVDYLALVLLPALHGRVAEEAFAVDIAVRSLPTQSVGDMLRAGEIDLYLGVHGDTERALETQLLFEEGLCVVVRPGHPLCADASPEAYARSPHLHVSPRREPGSLVDRALAAVGLRRRVAVEVPYFGLVPGLLRRSDLVATLPERLARRFAADHGLALVPPPVSLPAIRIVQAWHPSGAAEPALRWLRTQVAAVASGT